MKAKQKTPKAAKKTKAKAKTAKRSNHMGATWRNTLAKNLVKFRGAAKLTQRQVGSKVGMHYTNIAHFENGSRSPNVGSLVKLARALGVSVDKLVA